MTQSGGLEGGCGGGTAGKGRNIRLALRNQTESFYFIHFLLETGDTNTLKPATLFQASECDAHPTNRVNFVLVTINGTRWDIDPYSLFDGNAYDELLAVSYASSPKAFAKVAERFERVEFILGTPDSSFGEFASLAKTLNPESAIEFWNGLTPVLREKIINGQICIRYPCPGVAIHSKLYLLRNTGTSKTRLMLGSANLSEQAFTRRPQFEELIVFDDSPELFNVYMERFGEIRKSTVDYIPEDCRKHKDTGSLFVADEATIARAIQQTLAKNKTVTIESDEIAAMEDIAFQQMPREIQELERTIRVVRRIASNAKDNAAALSPAVVAATLPKIQLQVSRQRSSGSDTRSVLLYDDAKKLLYAELHDHEPRLAYPVSKEATIDEIKTGLQSISDFVEAYNLFTFREDRDNQARVMETILYAFMAPYLWKARDDMAKEKGLAGMRAHIPPFLVLGGKARSGKTTLLAFIHRLLGASSEHAHFPYQAIEKTLPDMIDGGNLFPILIDEIPTSFFRSTRDYKGDQLIKRMANELVGKHPVVIATTNHDNFSIGDQALRRIYYLTIDNTFDKNRVVESTVHLEDVLGRVNGTLFADFAFRMQEYLGTGGSLASQVDPLFKAREIFAHYYSMTKTQVPHWFPQTRFDDYEDRGRTLWSDVFRLYGQHFKRGEDNVLSVHCQGIGWDDRQKDQLTNYLPPQLVIENRGVLILRRREFFEWIRVRRKRRLSLTNLILLVRGT